MTAERMQHFGDWTVGDTLRALEYTTLNLDGSAYDLTGKTAKLKGRSVDNPVNKLDAATTISSPATGKIVVVPAMTLTSGKARETYECQFEVTRTSDGKVTYTEPFTIAIRKASIS